ncbi:MAG: hypothetical protein FJ102_27360 [Deltaproteobacteria bacterium]|nr:hypothetical protein [Deltaproteobacteria bacterium]
MPLILLAADLAAAGPWLRDAGSAYVKGAVGGFAGLDGEAGAMEAPVSYRDASASLYGELGLPWSMQASAYAPYVIAVNQRPEAAYASFGAGDAELLVSRQIIREPLALSLGVGAKLPLYADRAGDREDAYGAAASRFPEAGDGQVDIEARLEAGRSFRVGRVPGWVQASGAYRHRTGDFVDGVPWSAQLGLSPRRGDESGGWAGVEASGVVNVVDDAHTRSWTRLGAFGAVRLDGAWAIEAWAGVIPWASASQRGAGGGVGLSYQHR